MPENPVQDNSLPDNPVPEKQHDDAAAVGAGPVESAAGAGPRPLPGELMELTSQLESLVGMGAEYAAQKPEEATAGLWWWDLARSQINQMVTERGQPREAAVLALFWPGADGPKVLVTERSPELAKHPGQLAFPGGGAEAYDADSAATALREAQEEAGVDPSLVRVIGALPPAPMPFSGFNVTPVVAVAEDPGTLVPQVGEVSRVLKLPVAELVRAEHRYTAVVVHRGPRMPSPAFLRVSASPAESPAPDPDYSSTVGEDFFIWGFTGTLLDRMLTRLGWAGTWDRSREIDPRQFRRR